MHHITASPPRSADKPHLGPTISDASSSAAHMGTGTDNLTWLDLLYQPPTPDQQDFSSTTGHSNGVETFDFDWTSFEVPIGGQLDANAIDVDTLLAFYNLAPNPDALPFGSADDVFPSLNIHHASEYQPQPPLPTLLPFPDVNNVSDQQSPAPLQLPAQLPLAAEANTATNASGYVSPGPALSPLSSSPLSSPPLSSLSLPQHSITEAPVSEAPVSDTPLAPIIGHMSRRGRIVKPSNHQEMMNRIGSSLGSLPIQKENVPPSVQSDIPPSWVILAR